MPLDELLARWQKDADTIGNIPAWRTLPRKEAETSLPPSGLPPLLARRLEELGITELFSHQIEAWESARRGEHVVLATGTASGKTLAYNLPVLAGLLADPAGRALYLYPTKALAQDQLNSLLHLTGKGSGLSAAIYDGDTPASRRSPIRREARLLLTNPDMLHAGILPHHTLWEGLFRNLRFVVIDEMHSYRGVFGSHVANVLRRLKRVARFYGAEPQFLLSSATIGNPGELAERLVEERLYLVDRDGSGHGPRHFLIYNPPVIDPSLGLRKSSTQEAVRLAGDLLEAGLQGVVFARSRRSVEILLRYLQEASGSRHAPGAIRGYRSGYLSRERREIEAGLRDGTVRMVVATNALELGIDIGGLGASLLVGYPGTVASARQQAGRAGRGMDPALAILVATPGPLDQFLASHPSYLLDRSPEQALLDPDHLLILLNHLRCAAFELPFHSGEGFGRLSAERVEEFLHVLDEGGELHRSEDRYFWMADSYPAAGISLRSVSPQAVVLQAQDEQGPHIIGQVDFESALWMVHPRAVYLHEGQQYFVQELDLEKANASLVPVSLDYFTEPVRETSIQVQSVSDAHASPACEKAWGELVVTSRVTGFRKRSWLGGENLGQESLDLPAQDLVTTGYWLSISEATIQSLKGDGLWTNAPNEYGPEWKELRERVRRRDGFRCQSCGQLEAGREHDIHHRIPFRSFRGEAGSILREQANRLENLVTLCRECHRRVETAVRVRSGLAGLGYVLSQLAPLFLMCDPGDLGVHIEPVPSQAFPQPAVILYDVIPAGIGFSQKLYGLHADLLLQAYDLVRACPCEDGCPSCVGPGGENGLGGKQETLALLTQLRGGS